MCRSHARRYQAAVRDDLKLRYHFAGRHVIATTGHPGLQIHAIDLVSADEVRNVYQRLRAQGHRDVTSLYPTLWKDDSATIVTVNPQS